MTANSKFQVGDKVIAVCDTPTVAEGWIGFVIGNKPYGSYEVFAAGVTGDEAFFEKELELLSVSQDKKPDVVNSPKHYAVFDDIEAIEIIARSMTKEMFKGYCFGNLLKYRLRAGGKDELQQEISKANKYKELFEKYKDICQ